MLAIALAALAAYLLGSVPIGFLAGKCRGVDLRTQGSGNIGATNAVRVLGKKIGYLVFLGDFLKGILAIVVARVLASQFADASSDGAAVVAAIAVLLGHNFPVWLAFKGGKGIATSAGIIVALFPWPVFGVAVLAWVTLFFTTRYVSIASIAASLALPGTLWVMHFFQKNQSPWLLATATVMCLLALWRHRGNVQRLLNGTESRFERKKPAGKS